MRKLFEGVCTAIVTPFKGGRLAGQTVVDFDALGELVEMQLRGGVGSILVLGTTGESAALSFDERGEVIKFVIERVSGAVPVVVGASGNNLEKVLELANQAKELRASAILVTAPYYVRGTQSGIVQWFKTIGKVGVPIVAYNIPGRAGVNITPATMAIIAKDKSIVGIKESSGNIEQICEVIRLCPKVAVYAGDDLLSLPAYAVGAKGVVSVASNIIPEEVNSIWVAHRRGTNNRARKLFLEQLPFYRSLFTEVNPVPIKKMLADSGLISNIVRLPLTAI